MAKMTVYHGGYTPVKHPEIRVGRNTEEALKCLEYRGYEEVK